MSLEAQASSLLERASALHERVEVFVKRGRSRLVEIGIASGELASFREEEGWALRFGNGAGHAFLCETAAAGRKPFESSLAEASLGEGALRLPAQGALIRAHEPDSSNRRLLRESEGMGFMRTLALCLERELEGAYLVSGRLEDGQSESWVMNTEGISAPSSRSLVVVRLEAAVRTAGSVTRGARSRRAW